MRSPANVQRTQRGTEPYERRAPSDAVGDELRAGKKIQERIVQDKASCDRLTVSGIVAQRGGQLTTDKMAGMDTKPGDDQGIEAFNADVPAVSVQEGFGLLTEFPISGTVLDLHDQRLGTADGAEHIREQRDLLIRPVQTEGTQFFQGELIDTGMDTADPIKCIVVKYDHLAVFAETDIQLNAVAFLCSLPKGGKRVFRDAPVTAVQTPMGVVDSAENRTVLPTEVAGGKRVNRQSGTDRGENEKRLQMIPVHDHSHSSAPRASRPDTLAILDARMFLTRAVKTQKLSAVRIAA